MVKGAKHSEETRNKIKMKLAKPFIAAWMLLSLIYWSICYPDLIDEIIDEVGNETLEY